MTDGRLFTVVGPSGAGKDTLLLAVAARLPRLRRVRRVITRPATAGGEDFESVSMAGFARRRAAGEFALWWAAHGFHYGIPRAVDAWLALGEDVIFNGSRAVLGSAVARYPNLRVLHVTASPAVLAERLARRGRETSAEIAERLARSDFILPDGLDVTMIRNDGKLSTAVAEMIVAIQHEAA